MSDSQVLEVKRVNDWQLACNRLPLLGIQTFLDYVE